MQTHHEQYKAIVFSIDCDHGISTHAIKACWTDSWETLLIEDAPDVADEIASVIETDHRLVERRAIVNHRHLLEHGIELSVVAMHRDALVLRLAIGVRRGGAVLHLVEDAVGTGGAVLHRDGVLHKPAGELRQDIDLVRSGRGGDVAGDAAWARLADVLPGATSGDGQERSNGKETHLGD